MAAFSQGRVCDRVGRPSNPHTWPVAGRDACPAKRRTDQVRTLTAQMDEPLYRGASAALVALLGVSKKRRARGGDGNVPGIWNEHWVSLCGTDAPVASFPWVDASLNNAPGYRDALELVCVVMDRLEMAAPEVVTAVVLLDAFVSTHGEMLHPHSARPMLLACCILACKLTTDEHVTTTGCCEAVRDCFTSLAPLQAARIEEQLLVYLDWRVPNDPDVYRACALNLHMMGGGTA